MKNQGEKDIMRAIFDAGFPAIILRENPVLFPVHSAKIMEIAG